ncbi:NeuD/PglB/VioB family sugar acetyltransferase [Rhodopirellula baltica]|uniref:Sialic acid O-acyltransferase, NeuD n=1 Tax=Rhodopirellula baltica WH47 TaxID=991778 RepID=F2ALQ3_RHOBT|nr:NeuD/PglB/VioB family sugar acetyltransferase [Rhodopirellula baltica]EGF29399.1 Sialic acid O-acyltransferase, NeuD [Rhodopirellula baltica WH47]
MRQLLLIGAGGHCHSCIETIESSDQFQIAGIVGSPNEVGTSVLGYDVIGSDVDLPLLLQRIPNAIIAAGQIQSPDLRVRLFELATNLGAVMPAITASTAVVSRHASLGPGTIVMHGGIVNAGAKVGTNGIINSMALIEHDSIVEDHCHVSTAAVLNGGVHVGSQTFIGSRCVVHQSVSIGQRCVIAAGAVVRSNVEDGRTVHYNSNRKTPA